jgi:hypothetical protein
VIRLIDRGAMSSVSESTCGNTVGVETKGIVHCPCEKTATMDGPAGWAETGHPLDGSMALAQLVQDSYRTRACANIRAADQGQHERRS